MGNVSCQVEESEVELLSEIMKIPFLNTWTMVLEKEEEEEEDVFQLNRTVVNPIWTAVKFTGGEGGRSWSPAICGHLKTTESGFELSDF